MRRILLAMGLVVGSACAVEEREEAVLRLADAVAEACPNDDVLADEVAAGDAEAVASAEAKLDVTPKCTDADGNDITDEETCSSTKCGPTHDRTDCFWAGTLRGCRCPNGLCAKTSSE